MPKPLCIACIWPGSNLRECSWYCKCCCSCDAQSHGAVVCTSAVPAARRGTAKSHGKYFLSQTKQTCLASPSLCLDQVASSPRENCHARVTGVQSAKLRGRHAGQTVGFARFRYTRRSRALLRSNEDFPHVSFPQGPKYPNIGYRGLL